MRIAFVATLVSLTASCELIGGIDDRTLGACVAGTVRCAAGARQACAADGAAWIESPCGAEAPICTGAGQCVACAEPDGMVVSEGEPDDCRGVACVGGALVDVALPDDVIDPRGDCSTRRCEDGTVVVTPDGADFVDDLDRCTLDRCEAGRLVVEPTVAPDAPCELSEGPSVETVCARRGDGTVLCWGANDKGQLGLGTADGQPHSTPAAVKGLPATSFVATGHGHACARTKDGALWCWGDNDQGQARGDYGPDALEPVAVPLGQRVLHVAAAYTNTCVVLEDTTVHCWGSNESGQLGDGTFDDRATPAPVIDPSREGGVLVGVKTVALTLSSACALLDSNDVVCWGASGNIGDGSTPADPEVVAPVKVHAGVAQLGAGCTHMCLRTTQGSVACWGLNSEGQCGKEPVLPSFDYVSVPWPLGLDDVHDVAGAWRHSCAAGASGVFCWGANWWGQLGDDNGCNSQAGCMGEQTPTPVSVVGLGAVDDLAAYWNNACAIVGGEIFCWGVNSRGQLGDGTTDFSDVPVKVAWPGP